MSDPEIRADPEPLRALVGPTASGKTALAIEVALASGAEIVSLDSMLVYRGMDVGTAKPSAEERARVAHHLVDVADPDERYDVQRFLADARTAEAEIRARGAWPLYVGGTGFYLKALVQGVFEGPPVDPELRARLEARAEDEGGEALHAELAAVDPEAAARLHPNDVRRVVRGLEVHAQTGRTLTSWQTQWRDRPGRPRRLCGLAPEPDELERRIRERTRAMLDAGWPEEAARVREAPGLGPTAIQALGYREALALHDGELTRAEARERIALRTRQFARRQRTWYRHFGEIVWVRSPRNEDARDFARALEEVVDALDVGGARER